MTSKRKQELEFINFFKKVRSTRGVTTREVEDKTGISYSYVSHLESSNLKRYVYPSTDKLNKLFLFYKLNEKEEEEFLNIYLKMILPEMYNKKLNIDKIKKILDILKE